MKRLNIYFIHSKKFDYQNLIYKKVLSSSVCLNQNIILPYSKNNQTTYTKDLMEKADLIIVDLYKPCLFPFSNLFINPEGIIYPCLSVAMGSLKEKSLKEIINEPRYKCFRKNLKASKLFTACQLCCEAYPKTEEGKKYE